MGWTNCGDDDLGRRMLRSPRPLVIGGSKIERVGPRQAHRTGSQMFDPPSPE
jgi:hypothetical protein